MQRVQCIKNKTWFAKLCHSTVELRYNELGYNVPQCTIPFEALPQLMALDKTYLGY